MLLLARIGRDRDTRERRRATRDDFIGLRDLLADFLLAGLDRALVPRERRRAAPLRLFILYLDRDEN